MLDCKCLYLIRVFLYETCQSLCVIYYEAYISEAYTLKEVGYFVLELFSHGIVASHKALIETLLSQEIYVVLVALFEAFLELW